MNPWAQRAFQIAQSVGHPDPALFVRQMMAESGLNPRAVSPVGATGIAQIMPATARGWGVDPNDPVASLTAAAKHMSRYYHSYNGDWARALAAYNAGPGAVQQYNGVPPYAETRNYIKKIMSGHSPSGVTPGRPQNGSQTPQGPSVDPVAVSNQINRISQLYSEEPILAQPHIDKLTQSLMGGGITKPSMKPAGVGSAKPGGFKWNRPKGPGSDEDLLRWGAQFGLRNPSSVDRPGTGSHHNDNRAVDWGDANNPMSGAAVEYAHANPHEFTEFYGPFDWHIEDGQLRPGAYPDHDDHIHGARSAMGINKRVTPPPTIRPANTRRRPTKRIRTQTNAPR